jgi:hypothetical protein
MHTLQAEAQDSPAQAVVRDNFLDIDGRLPLTQKTDPAKFEAE